MVVHRAVEQGAQDQHSKRPCSMTIASSLGLAQFSLVEFLLECRLALVEYQWRLMSFATIAAGLLRFSIRSRFFVWNLTGSNLTRDGLLHRCDYLLI